MQCRLIWNFFIMELWNGSFSINTQVNFQDNINAASVKYFIWSEYTHQVIINYIALAEL
jgi:hypothetical protein